MKGGLGIFDLDGGRGNVPIVSGMRRMLALLLLALTVVPTAVRACVPETRESSAGCEPGHDTGRGTSHPTHESDDPCDGPVCPSQRICSATAVALPAAVPGVAPETGPAAPPVFRAHARSVVAVESPFHPPRI